MSNKVIAVENLSKSYRLGQIGTGTFAHDLNTWWAKIRGKPNPGLKIGEIDHDNRDGEEVWALKDINFTVEQGEVLGIIGRNGAGKSTLLKILSRVTAPTSGRIKVKGRVASLLEVGTGFHPDLTGRENVFLNGAIMGMDRLEVSRKFDEIVDFSEVEKYIDTPVKRYSSGMYVRLAFAVAAHLEPEILVVDEVLAVGDAEFQKKCLGKMGEVAQGGRTVLFVSHNMVAIQNLCKRCLIVQNGHIQLDDKTSLVVDTYLSNNLPLESCIYDLREIERLSGLGLRTKFSKCIILNSDNIPSSVLHFGEPFKIQLELLSDSFQDNLVLAVGIDSVHQVRITTIRSDEYGLDLQISPNHTGIAILTFDKLSLAPGTYLLTLALRKGLSDIDVLWHVAQFHISESPINGKSPPIPLWGLVRTEVTWKID